MNGALILASAIGAQMFHLLPPPILGNTRCDDMRDCSAASREFTEIIERQFPLGTKEDALEAKLTAQGFERLPSSVRSCIPPGKSARVGALTIDCPSWDANWNPRHQLEYHFAGPLPACGRSVGVRWSSDSRGRITHTEAFYDFACL